MKVKRFLSILIAITLCIMLLIPNYHFTALTSSGTCYSADSNGAYRLSFKGNHFEFENMTAGNVNSLDIYYDIDAGTANFGCAVLLSNDVPNNALIVNIFDADSDSLNSFAINNIKVYDNTAFCFDGGYFYISNNKSMNTVLKYDTNGRLIKRYELGNRVSQLFCGFDGGAYAVSRNSVFKLEDDLYALSGDPVTPPLFPVSDDYTCSASGNVYGAYGNSVKDLFKADIYSQFQGGCALNDIIYIPDGKTIYGYDISSGEKRYYYTLDSDVKLLYADGDEILAICENRSLFINMDSFTRIEKDKNNGASENSGGTHSKDGDVKEIRSNIYDVDFSNYCISNITTNTTVAAFRKNMIYSGYDLKVYKNSSERKSGNIGTAFTAEFSNDKESITFELSVKGDLTGEGHQNTRDLTILMDYMVGAASFNGVYYMAADLNSDSLINAVDMALMKRNIS